MSGFRMPKILIWEVMKGWVRPKPLIDITAEEMEQAHIEVANSEHVILQHQFLLHMALCRIEALEDWNHNRRRDGSARMAVGPTADKVLEPNTYREVVVYSEVGQHDRRVYKDEGLVAKAGPKEVPKVDPEAGKVKSKGFPQEPWVNPKVKV